MGSRRAGRQDPNWVSTKPAAGHLEEVSRARDSGVVKIVILDAVRDNLLNQKMRSRGLARIDIRAGMVVALASAPGTTADDGTGRNSPFTAALVQRIQQPSVEIGTMSLNVRRDVWEKTNKKQMPEVQNALLGDFYLVQVQGKAAAWDRISQSGGAQDFADFIQRYPTAVHCPNAEYRLQTLNRLNNVEDAARNTGTKAGSDTDDGELLAKLQELQLRLDRIRKQKETDLPANKGALPGAQEGVVPAKP